MNEIFDRLGMDDKNAVVEHVKTKLSMEMLAVIDQVDAQLGEAMKEISSDKIQFGAPLNFCRYHYSGNIKMGTVNVYHEEAKYNPDTSSYKTYTEWRAVRYFYNLDFRGGAWLLCNGKEEFVSPFKNDLSDVYKKFGIDTYELLTNNATTLYGMAEPIRKLCTLEEKEDVARYVAHNYADYIVMDSMKESTNTYRCRFCAVDSYKSEEESGKEEIPIYPIYLTTASGNECLIGSYLSTNKKVHFELFDKQEEVRKAQQMIQNSKVRAKKVRRRKIGLIVGAATVFAIALIVVIACLV